MRKTVNQTNKDQSHIYNNMLLLTMPTDLLWALLEFLTLDSKCRFARLNHCCNQLLQPHIKQKKIQRFFPPHILMLLDFRNQYEWLPFQPRFVTDGFVGGKNSKNDINNIRCEDVKDAIMLGLDACQRPFVTIKVKINEKFEVLTWFQQYQGNPDFWKTTSNK